MGELITLIAEVGGRQESVDDLPGGYVVHTCRRADIEALGKLYFEAYDPGVACDTLEQATADIRASIEGEYGELWTEGSLTIVDPSGEPVAAMLTVHRGPWEDTPDCPFIIELFTARAHRRRGLARGLISYCISHVTSAGQQAIALRLDAHNKPARNLYESLGFKPWDPNPRRP